MFPTDLEDFATGYADAEEDMLENDFNLTEVFNLLRHCKALDPYEQGYLMKLQEEYERTNQ